MSTIGKARPSKICLFERWKICYLKTNSLAFLPQSSKTEHFQKQFIPIINESSLSRSHILNVLQLQKASSSIFMNCNWGQLRIIHPLVPSTLLPFRIMKLSRPICNVWRWGRLTISKQGRFVKHLVPIEIDWILGIYWKGSFDICISYVYSDLVE